MIFQVSIHAPRTGCDAIGRGARRPPASFNSRTPHGVRLRLTGFFSPPIQFQFTHPARGATRTVKESRKGRTVSIHAPRTGCDIINLNSSNHIIMSFNSRTPHGVRQDGTIVTQRDWRFNSRTPHGVRPNTDVIHYQQLKFQFTHPARGATAYQRVARRGTTRFNSRTPHGVRPPPKYETSRRTVSIHAPRTGCD